MKTTKQQRNKILEVNILKKSDLSYYFMNVFLFSHTKEHRFPILHIPH